MSGIPFRMSPCGTVMDMPHKEHLVAWYDGKFHTVEGREISEAGATAGNTIIAQYNADLPDINIDIWFGDGVTYALGMRWGAHYNLYAVGGDRMCWRTIPDYKPLKGAIVGSGSAYYYYVYKPTISIGAGGSTSNMSKPASSASSYVNFGCCFDTKLTYNQFKEVAAWIERKYPVK